ncbi:MAG: RagB/SusD family nutrient uptake outer membrane protein [Bacteroides sp.]
MKRNIFIALAGSCLLTVSSCVDLDQEPKSFIQEEQFIQQPQTLPLVEKSVSGIYNDLWSGNYDFCCRMIRYNTAAGDVVPQLAKPNNDMLPLYNMNPSAGNIPKDSKSLWENFWKVINSTNKIISGTPIPEGDKGKPYKAVVAEARFLRGLAYFYLVRIFGDVPKVTNTEEALKKGNPRVAVKIIYDEVIVPDLVIACADLPAKSRSGNSSTPSMWAAKTLLSDVYMTMAGWPLKLGKEYYAKAAAQTKDIITNAGLTLTKPYDDLWKEDKKGDANEHLFALHNSVAFKNPSQYGKSFFASDYWPAGWGDYFASADFMKAYPNDDRKDWNFETEWYKDKKKTQKVTWETSANKLPLIKKFRDYDDVNPKTGVISQLSNGLTTIYRYADALLMYAEASTLATGQVDDMAKNALKEVQLRANMPADKITNTTDAKAFDDAVFAERGWELYVEGKRWFDIVRREKAGEIRPKVYNESFYKANGHYYLPIPEEEVRMAEWKNNPGY